jgi:lipid II:glycine glycyltransferase (peptidoglycan interpeptide bridge formation enzyme)
MLQLVPATEQATYDQFVLEHNGSFLQSWGWGQWQAAQGRHVMRFVWQQDGAIVAAVQAIRLPLPFRAGFYWYIPYGPVFANGVGAAAATTLLSDTLAKEPKTLFVKVEPAQAAHIVGHKGLRLQPGTTLVTDLTQSEEQLLAGMHHKTRYNIKVAQKHGVTVTHQHTAAQQAAAIKLLTDTSSRQGFRSYPASYYEQLLAHGQKSFTTHLYSASINETIIAVGLMLDFGSTRTYLFGGSDYDHRALMSPHLLHFTAMEDAKALGLTSYDWWGLDGSRHSIPGVAKFKLGFGGRTVTYPPALDIPVQKLSYYLYRAAHRVRRMF